ncbi:MAG: type II secretion system protein [Verrucomicrobiota bacterium]
MKNIRLRDSNQICSRSVSFGSRPRFVVTARPQLTLRLQAHQGARALVGQRVRRSLGGEGSYSVGGFTLVELLAAMVVLALLMTIIFGIFNQASKAWILAENRTENFQGARSTLDLMSRELEGAIVGGHTNTNGTVTRLNLITFEDSGLANVKDAIGNAQTATFSTGLISPINNLSATSPNDAIFFVTQTPDSKSISAKYIDLAECGYFVAYSKAKTGNAGLPKGFYGLFRHFESSANANNWDIFSSPVNWWATSPDTKTPLLENVIRFEVRYEYGNSGAGVTNGTSIVENWNSISGGPSSAVVPDPTIQLPRAFHLRLSVLDRRYAMRVATVMNSLGGAWADGTMNGELSKIPYDINGISNTALRQTFKEGLRTFFRSVYPRGAM